MKATSQKNTRNNPTSNGIRTLFCNVVGKTGKLNIPSNIRERKNGGGEKDRPVDGAEKATNPLEST